MDDVIIRGYTKSGVIITHLVSATSTRDSAFPGHRAIRMR